ncbi:hypothetical protein [Hyphomicrobium sulfonivorans]|uniref:Transmembrane protein n=1 Tax=Hyphomicrobium sulfonivorans TaxID=121290 RepID=A0A109BI62_HYPSL|nr:hypothetical protein [Hyphomicrobium sulfonivorans]KWT68960.1 hypothetical protein APY04_1782 [Hyphomicrobium sulfonivorans]MBI1650804.1 hypothetical protein [Hyphomicrobium sulfonivorans]
MSKNNKQAVDREALERLLDIYGADRTRWPARERLRFASIISDDDQAAKMLAQARALDRLLDQATPAGDATLEALKGRIMAAALAERGSQAGVVGDGQPHVGGGASVTSLSAVRERRAARNSAVGSFGEWPAAAVLAASLVLGVMLGWGGAFTGTMTQMAQVAGLEESRTDTASTYDISQLALSSEVDSQYEDML